MSSNKLKAVKFKFPTTVNTGMTYPSGPIMSVGNSNKFLVIYRRLTAVHRCSLPIVTIILRGEALKVMCR